MPTSRSLTRHWHALLTAVLAVAALAAPGLTGEAEAKTKCKQGLTNIYRDDFVVAKVITEWCYNGRSVTSRNSVPSARVRPVAYVVGVREAEAEWTYSACHDFNGIKNHNCLTKRQFSFEKPPIKTPLGNISLPKTGVCIETRIYGNGAHHRRISTTC
ncbi:MAG TPA: hypothetical protein VNA11_17740 [Pseudonocardia sp.]|jgi:hypothetical protein|nr:hypothetical protein [Pseudonocardia sp.]